VVARSARAEQQAVWRASRVPRERASTSRARTIVTFTARATARRDAPVRGESGQPVNASDEARRRQRRTRRQSAGELVLQRLPAGHRVRQSQRRRRREQHPARDEVIRTLPLTLLSVNTDDILDLVRVQFARIVTISGRRVFTRARRRLRGPLVRGLIATRASATMARTAGRAIAGIFPFLGSRRNDERRHLDAVRLSPGDLLSIREATATPPALLRRAAAARTVLARVGGRRILQRRRPNDRQRHKRGAQRPQQQQADQPAPSVSRQQCLSQFTKHGPVRLGLTR
jgi:hypothetical protein